MVGSMSAVQSRPVRLALVLLAMSLVLLVCWTGDHASFRVLQGGVR